MTRVVLLGDGAVARALAQAFGRIASIPAESTPDSPAAAPSFELARWSRRAGGPIPPGDVAILAVRDEAIGELAAQVMDQGIPSTGSAAPVLLHCAGGLSAEEAFAGLREAPGGIGLMHPLRAFANPVVESDLRGAVFAVEGDAAGVAVARKLVAALGATALELPPAALARYHAAAVLVANHAVGLVSEGARLLGGLGLEPKAAVAALAALLASTAANLERVGLPDALTGPLARGDVAMIDRHLRALALDPAAARLYRETARPTLEVAQQKRRFSPGNSGDPGDPELALVRELLDKIS